MKFFESFANIFRVPDLRRRVLFTLAMLAIYRLGGHIPTPGIDTHRLEQFFEQNQGSLFGFIDLFSGGMFRKLTIFALGIMPYITASIILQLLTVVVPTLEKLQKEGELGRRKITQWTRYLTVGLALMQSFGIAAALQNSQGGFVMNPGIGFVAMTMLSLTTGTAFIMWLGEQISERGIGNGMSLIIFTGIVVGLPNAIGNIYQNVFLTHQWTAIHVIIIMIFMIAVVGFIVLVERGERRIPVQYAKRVVGRRMMGGQQTYLPLKVNAGGVIPVIFASSLLAFPQTFLTFEPLKQNAWISGMLRSMGYGEPLYALMFVAGIIFFCYFYVSIIFNPNEHAQVRRVYPRDPPREEHGRLYEQNPDQDYNGRGTVSLGSVADSPDHDLRDQVAAPSARHTRQLHRRAFPALVAGWPGGIILLWRYLAAHCGRGGDGHRQPD
jgi:preprotein translocase subunit SecY